MTCNTGWTEHGIVKLGKLRARFCLIRVTVALVPIVGSLGSLVG